VQELVDELVLQFWHEKVSPVAAIDTFEIRGKNTDYT
jgi:hypothetical protein